MTYISTLKLNYVRCYDHAVFESLLPGFIVLYGPNGAGKTNVLEAVSLLCPGRGLRRAKLQDIQHNQKLEPWAISATLQTAYASIQVGTGLDPRTDKRIVRINGETAKGINELGNYIASVWIVPQMDRLFTEATGVRRRFLDRLIFAFDPGHSGRLARYSNALSQRSKLLKSGQSEPAWLNGLETQIAETGVAISAARLHFIEKLSDFCQAEKHTTFPTAQLEAKGTLEDMLAISPALEVEDIFKRQLLDSRGVDMLTGGAAIGPHKSDLHAVYTEKNMHAALCSTGEQKALLVGIILAHARMIKNMRGAPPVLLLDEVTAHLDSKRQGSLYEILEDMDAQVWITGTDKEIFSDIKKNAQTFLIENAKLHMQPRDMSEGKPN